MSKKSFIDSVTVGVPCSEDWEKMRGTDRVRFCSHCAKNVQNLSAVTRKEAARLVRSSDGNICIRYIKHPVTHQPIFSEQLFQITRRTPSLVAGVMTASLALSTIAYPQSPAPAPIPVSTVVESTGDDAEKEEPETTEGPALGSIEGIVLDISGIPVSDVEMMLVNAGTDNSFEHQTTDHEGRYRFEELEPGTYTIRITSATGLMKKAVRGMQLAEGEKAFRNIYVKVIEAEEGEGGIGSGSGYGYGGAIATVEYDLPLNRAVADNDIAEVRKLLAAGERVNGRDKNYDEISPLHLAVEYANVEMVRLLLAHDAKVNARDKSERTPLMFIDGDATPELIEVLLDAGAKVNARDDSGNDVLLTTIGSISIEVLSALIKGGANVRQADEDGVTALMMAAEEEDLEKVTALVLAGADVDKRDESGETAWDKTSNTEIELFLESHGATVDQSTIEVLQVVLKAGDDEEEEPDETSLPEDRKTNENEPATARWSSRLGY